MRVDRDDREKQTYNHKVGERYALLEVGEPELGRLVHTPRPARLRIARCEACRVGVSLGAGADRSAAGHFVLGLAALRGGELRVRLGEKRWGHRHVDSVSENSFPKPKGMRTEVGNGRGTYSRPRR